VAFLDLRNAETKLGEQLAESLTPEKAYERRWAITLLEQVYQRLGQEYGRAGKAGLFEALRGALSGAGGNRPLRGAGRAAEYD